MKNLTELEKRRMIKEANRILDRVEYHLHFIVDSIKAKKKKAA